MGRCCLLTSFVLHTLIKMLFKILFVPPQRALQWCMSKLKSQCIMRGGLEELRAVLYENMKARVQHFKPPLGAPSAASCQYPATWGLVADPRNKLGNVWVLGFIIIINSCNLTFLEFGGWPNWRRGSCLADLRTRPGQWRYNNTGLQFYKCGHKQKHPSGWELLTWDIWKEFGTIFHRKPTIERAIINLTFYCWDLTLRTVGNSTQSILRL